LINNLLILNAIGRVFVGSYDCPFRIVNEVLGIIDINHKAIDFHAETTSEKAAFVWYLDGSVVGAYTHEPTVDSRVVLARAFTSDVVMMSPINSVIGSEPVDVLERFLSQA